MGKKRYRGHYCWVCGRIRANERFSGKGHARHVCRDCELKRRAKAREKRRSKHEGLPVYPEERPNPVTAGDS